MSASGPSGPLVGNSDTSLFLFLKGHFDKPVNCDGIFQHFGKVRFIIVT